MMTSTRVLRRTGTLDSMLYRVNVHNSVSKTKIIINRLDTDTVNEMKSRLYMKTRSRY